MPHRAGESVDLVGVTETPTTSAVAYDFRRPMTLAREHARQLEMAFGVFARHWANQMVARLRASVEITFDHVEMCTYEEYVNAMPTQTMLLLCNVEPGRRTAVLQFSLETMLVWIDLVLGGEGKDHAVETRELTDIEVQLTKELMRRTFQDLNYSFQSIVDLQAEFRGAQYAPQFMQLAEASAPVIVSHMHLKAGERELEPATLMLPGEAIVSAMKEADSSDHRSEEQVELERIQRGQLMTAMSKVPVEAGVRFRMSTVNARAVADLAVGDVLPLHHPSTRPLDVVVGNRVLAQAAPGTQGSRLAGMVVNVKENR